MAKHSTGAFTQFLCRSFGESTTFRRFLAVCCLFTGSWSGTAEAQTKTARKIIVPAVNPKLIRPLSSVQSRSIVSAAPIPLTSAFQLSSRPTASKTIYLDFTGHVTRGTFWNDPTVTSIVTAPFSTDSDPAFSNADLTAVIEVWQRVAECYAPFDVNVTTLEPPTSDLINAGGTDFRWGMRVLIGTSTPSPAPGAGGVAFIGSFTWNNDTPCFVFPASLALTAKFIADASVHEVGHTLGLVHDGRFTPAEAYYQGHGTGPTSWAPHMGVGYYVNFVQWSKGEYTSANNQEDDLDIITTQNGFTYRPDDYGNSTLAASTIQGVRGTGTTVNVFNVNQSGIIERRTDTDWFKLVVDSGKINISAAGAPANTMLDIQMDLYSKTGSIVASSNPADLLTATISQNISAGTYYLKIDGVGKGDPLLTGYTDYSSLGQYTLSGTYPAPPIYPPSKVIATYNLATKTLNLTGDALANTMTVRLEAGSLRVEGAKGTSINNASFFAVPHTGKLIFNADLGSGNDAISVIGIDSSSTNLTLGVGDDLASITLSTIGVLTIDGGAGTDTVTLTTNTIGTFNKLNLP